VSWNTGKITEIYELDGRQMGKVDFGGVSKETCLDFVPKPRWRLLHHSRRLCAQHTGRKRSDGNARAFPAIEEIGQELEPI